jgi:hypothetical protein
VVQRVRGGSVLGRPRSSTARNLLVHPAQEMIHLAGFIRARHERFGDD